MMWKRILWTVYSLSNLAGVSYAAQQEPPPVKSPEEEAANDPPDPLKYGPVKLGLDSLARAEAATNFSLGSFSFTPGSNEGRILFRLRPSVTVSPSENLTARVEGQWYAFYDDRDVSRFTLYQGYVEGTVPGAKKFSVKAGRQEFVYGSGFLLGNDALYDGLTFDALRASLEPVSGISVELFGGIPPENAGSVAGCSHLPPRGKFSRPGSPERPVCPNPSSSRVAL